MATAEDRRNGRGFEYLSLAPSVAKFLKGQAERIRRSQAASIIQIGKSLIEAKRYLSHGQFLRWVESEAGLQARTAQAFMRVAQWTKGKGAIVAHLPPTLLYFLSAPSTPGELAAALLERLEAGERIDVAAAKGELTARRKVSRPGSATAGMETAPALPRLRAETVLPEHSAQTAMTHVVTILVRELSPIAFARVCRFMMSKALLESPDLAEEIAAAFGAAAIQSRAVDAIRDTGGGGGRVPHAAHPSPPVSHARSGGLSMRDQLMRGSLPAACYE
jgi:hypothetical protein